MATQRLNNYMRERIAKCVMDKTDFSKIIEDLEAQEITPEEIYSAYYDKETLKKMEALPEGWLCKVDSFYVNLGGCSHWIAFKDKEGDPVRKLILWKDRNERITFPVDHPLVIRFQKNHDELIKAREEASRFASKVMATLRSATTVGKLLTIWPELKEICPPEYFFAVEPSLPAIIVDDLNKHINFKKAE